MANYPPFGVATVMLGKAVEPHRVGLSVLVADRVYHRKVLGLPIDVSYLRCRGILELDRVDLAWSVVTTESVIGLHGRGSLPGWAATVSWRIASWRAGGQGLGCLGGAAAPGRDLRDPPVTGADPRA